METGGNDITQPKTEEQPKTPEVVDTPDFPRPTESIETYLENQERWDYDLPLVTDEDRRERLREEMWDKYGYDIDK